MSRARPRSVSSASTQAPHEEFRRLATSRPRPSRRVRSSARTDVVPATKKVLDQVGSGKMTFDEFRKAATVDYTGGEKEKDKDPRL